MSQPNFNYSIKHEIKENLSLSLPLIASQLLYSSSGFIGTAMVARLGEDALAASVLVNMTWFSISVLFFGLLNSVAVLVAHQYGAKNDKAISEIMGQAFILGGIVFITCLLCLTGMPYILHHYTSQDTNVLSLATRYMYSMIWNLPALIILIIWEQFLAGANRARLVLRISLCVVPMEITLIYALIFGKFGLPACGIAGIGYGFAASYTITATFLTIYLLRAKFFKKYEIAKGFLEPNFIWLKELIRVGLPMGAMYAVEVSSFAVATFWIARFGTSILAAHQIAMQYLNFAVTIVFAMSQAVCVRVGHAVGRRDKEGVRYASYVGMLMNASAVLLIACAFILIPDVFFRLDVNVNDPKNFNLIQEAKSLLSIIGIFLFIENFRIIIGFGALRGLKDTKFGMYLSMVSFWIFGLCSAYLLGFTFNYQGVGIWWGLTMGVFVGSFIFMMRFRYLLRQVDLEKLMEVK